MTGDLNGYLSRITSEHRNKPNFIQSVVVSIEPLIGVQAVQNNLYTQFDIESAIGVQLDQVGQWLGTTRLLSTPLADVFFSWDTPSLGWDQGIWQGEFDPTSGLTSLPDSIYRQVLILDTYINSWDGTVGGLDTILQGSESRFASIFPGLVIAVIDGGAAGAPMQTTYQLYGNQVFGNYSVNGISPIIQQLFLQGYFTPKPMAVAVNYEIWNGSAFVSSAFTFSLFIKGPASVASGASSMAVDGTVIPITSASGIRLELGSDSANPPPDMGSPAGAGILWANPQTSNNSTGTFSSATFDLTHYSGLSGTVQYLWAYDPVSGQLGASSGIAFS